MVILKFSQASQALQRGMLCEDSPTQQTAQAIAQKVVDSAGKYLTNALESWGSNMSFVFTAHLTYLLPFFHPSHLSVIARLPARDSCLCFVQTLRTLLSLIFFLYPCLLIEGTWIGSVLVFYFL